MSYFFIYIKKKVFSYFSITLYIKIYTLFPLTRNIERGNQEQNLFSIIFYEDNFSHVGPVDFIRYGLNSLDDPD